MMKRTIIALFAFSSASFAAVTGAQFNVELQKVLEEASYTLGDTFNITTTLSGLGNENSSIITLSDNYYIVNQGHSYWGLNSSASNNLTNNGE